jgi:hypothetical protein
LNSEEKRYEMDSVHVIAIELVAIYYEVPRFSSKTPLPSHFYSSQTLPEPLYSLLRPQLEYALHI